MNDDERDRARELLDQGLADQLFAFGRRFTSAIYWHDLNRPSGCRLLHHGSIFFLDLGEGILGITATHVFHQYRTDLKSHPGLECQVGELRFNPEDRLRGESSPKDLDITTFCLEPDELALIGREPLRPRSCPPANLTPGHPAVAFGYPKAFRREAERRIAWGHLSGIGESTHAGLLFPPELTVTHPSPFEYEHLGGCSGGPIFSVGDDLDLQGAELFGVLTDWSEDGVAMGFSASCIQPNGEVVAPLGSTRGS